MMKHGLVSIHVSCIRRFVTHWCDHAMYITPAGRCYYSKCGPLFKYVIVGVTLFICCVQYVYSMNVMLPNHGLVSLKYNL